MLPAVLLTALATLAGALATYLYDHSLSLLSRLAYGAVTGLAVVALVAFVLAHLLGIALATVIAGTLALLAVAALAWWRRIRRAVTADLLLARAHAAALTRPSLAVGAVLYGLALVVLLWLAFERVIVIEPGGIATGYANNLGDLPFHMHISASFAYSANYPPYDPTFAGSGFAYPYMADFISATYLALGADMREAFFLLNVVLGAALLVVVHRATLVLTRDPLAALVAPALVLLSGGLGWIDALADSGRGEQGLLAFLGALPQDYTITGDGPYRWGNAITTLLVPQRSLLFGLPLSLIVFAQLWRLIQAPAVGSHEPRGAASAPTLHGLRPSTVLRVVRERPEAVAAGVFSGLLPLIHAHSFIVVMGTAFMLGLLFRQWREGRWLPWAIYVVVTLSIALPEAWWSTRDSIASAGSFFGLEIGWDRGALDPITFWLLNTGFFIPLIFVALAVPRLRRRLPAGLLLFSLPFLAWFVLPNVVKLAPWVWDNIKVLFYWYVGFVPIVALLIAWLLRDGRAQRAAGTALLFALVLAGSLDVWRVVSGQTLFDEFDNDGVAIAGQILSNTPQRATVLHAPTWNTPAFMAGRQSLLGYPGHMWSRGLDYGPRENEIRQIYGGEAMAGELIDRHGVDYVLLTPLERDFTVVDEDFLGQFTEVASAGEYRLLQVAP